jgi:hypothetical protein
MAVAFDEMNGTEGATRPAYQELASWLGQIPSDMLQMRRREAELLFRRIGITFAVYGESDSTERLIPFDVIPRVLAADEWDTVKRGLEQRTKAINLYIKDIYSKRECCAPASCRRICLPESGVPARDERAARAARHLRVHRRHRHRARRLPTHSTCWKTSAHALRRLLHAGEPRDHAAALPRPVRAPSRRAGRELSGRAARDPEIGRAGDRRRRADGRAAHPGIYNSAYYEHSFLADKLGIELVEGRDLIVKGEIVYMRTTEGLKRVDVIYRRIDDDFLDPLSFRPDSALGVPGLMSAYIAGNVTLANAVGTGVADDKAVYSYMPEIVRFYLGEEPILKNVPTWRCREPEHLSYVLDNLSELVVKEVHGSGGYGMLIGPKADKMTLEAFREKLKARSARLHRAADARALHRADPGGGRPRAAPRRPAPVRAHRQGQDPHRARRADTRRAEGGFAGGQLEPGRRHEGHLGVGYLNALPHRRQHVLARALRGALPSTSRAF